MTRILFIMSLCVISLTCTDPRLKFGAGTPDAGVFWPPPPAAPEPETQKVDAGPPRLCPMHNLAWPRDGRAFIWRSFESGWDAFEGCTGSVCSVGFSLPFLNTVPLRDELGFMAIVNISKDGDVISLALNGGASLVAGNLSGRTWKEAMGRVRRVIGATVLIKPSTLGDLKLTSAGLAFCGTAPFDGAGVTRSPVYGSDATIDLNGATFVLVSNAGSELLRWQTPQ